MAAASRGDPGCGKACHEGDHFSPHRLVKHVEERRSMHADRMHIAAKRTIADLEHRAPGSGVRADQPIDPGTQGRDPIPQSERIEHGEPGGLQHETRANGMRRLEPFENCHPMPAAGQEERGAETARPRSDDGNIEGLLQGVTTS